MGSHRATRGGVALGPASGALVVAGIGAQFGGPIGAILRAGMGAIAGFGIGFGEKSFGVKTSENHTKKPRQATVLDQHRRLDREADRKVAQQKYAVRSESPSAILPCGKMLMLYSQATGHKMPLRDDTVGGARGTGGSSTAGELREQPAAYVLIWSDLSSPDGF